MQQEHLLTIFKFLNGAERAQYLAGFTDFYIHGLSYQLRGQIMGQLPPAARHLIHRASSETIDKIAKRSALNTCLMQSMMMETANPLLFPSTLRLLYDDATSISKPGQLELLKMVDSKLLQSIVEAALPDAIANSACHRVIHGCLPQLVYLLDQTIIRASDFTSMLLPEHTQAQHYNLLNLLLSPTKFSPDALQMLLGCQFTFDELFNCTHTYTLHYLLEGAKSVWNFLGSIPANARQTMRKELLAMESHESRNPIEFLKSVRYSAQLLPIIELDCATLTSFGKLPDAIKTLFSDALLKAINTNSEFVSSISVIGKQDRLRVATQFADKVKSFDDVIQITKLLPPCDRLTFALQHKTRITHFLEFDRVMMLLPELDKVKFVRELKQLEQKPVSNASKPLIQIRQEAENIGRLAPSLRLQALAAFCAKANLCVPMSERNYLYYVLLHFMTTEQYVSLLKIEMLLTILVDGFKVLRISDQIAMIRQIPAKDAEDALPAFYLQWSAARRLFSPVI